jgi:hypothetical protein
MVRVSIVDDSLAARVVIGKSNPAVVAPNSFAASRRVIFYQRFLDFARNDKKG